MYSRVAVIRHTTNWVVPARLLRWRMLARAKMDYGNERIVTHRRGRAQLCRCLWHASKLILRARSSLLAMAFKAELGGPPRPPGPQPGASASPAGPLSTSPAAQASRCGAFRAV